MNKTAKHIFFLAILSYTFFMLGNGLVPLSDPDEVFYAQTAREMSMRHEWGVPFLFGQPQFEKPIFIYWLLRVAFHIFGVTDSAARFFPALFAAMGVIAAYLLAMLGFNDHKKALASAFVLMSSILYIGLARTVFTDMIFSVFILLAMLAFFWGYSYRRRRTIGNILFFLFAALAVLSKGPLGLLLPLGAVAVFLFVRKDIRFLSGAGFLAGMAVFAVVCMPWYLYVTIKYGNAFIHEFFYNDHIRRFIFAEHHNNDRWYFYPGSILGLFFPWTFFLAAAIFRLLRPRTLVSTAHLFLLCWTAVVLLVFQAAHSKLISYILPLFPALAVLCGDFMGELAVISGRWVRGKVLFLLSWATVPVLLVIAGIVLSRLDIPRPSYLAVGVFAAAMAAWLSAMLVFVLRKQPWVSFCLLAFLLPITFVANPVNIEKLEPYFSSEDISAYIQKNCRGTGPILVSKFFARGVFYYTKRQVVVCAPGESNFFSPHPVMFLDNEEKVSDFLRRNRITYCVLKKDHVEAVESVANRMGFKHELLMSSGNACLLKVGA